MIEPRMATMLGYLTTDAAVDPVMLSRAVIEAARYTFNAITVDGEPSTNDCVLALANGASGVTINENLYPALFEAFRAVAHELALGIVRGGEGATKLDRHYRDRRRHRRGRLDGRSAQSPIRRS
jgi:glutamate N-acetyltransferase/amino-acid N-acetyltransferase